MAHKDQSQRGPNQNQPKLTAKEKIARRREKKAAKAQRYKEEHLMEKSQTSEQKGKPRETVTAE